MLVIVPTLHSFIIYFLVKFGCTPQNYFVFWQVLILIANAGYALGHFLSSIGKTTNMAISLAAPIVAIQILFSGFFIKKAYAYSSIIII